MFEAPQKATATALIAGQPVALSLRQAGTEIRLSLEQEIVVPEGAAAEVTLRWLA